MPTAALVTGATGFVGGRLAGALTRTGVAVRCLVRDSSRARHLEREGYELREADVTDSHSLAGVGNEIDVAYYLIHAMAGGPGFDERERQGAVNFARMAKEDGIPRVIYLGGLGDAGASKHLRSRHETARVLASEGPPLTYFRAAMVVGAGSESYRTLRYLVKRLPVMIAPAWLKTATQPIGIDDVVEYLRRAPDVSESEGREVQIGGPDVLSYGDMLNRMAVAMGRRPRPMLPVPLLTPALSALWLGLVTPVDTKVARPLVEGLTTATTVTDPSGARARRTRHRPSNDDLAQPRRHPARDLVRRRLDRDHRVHAQPGRQHRAVDHVQAAHVPGLAVGVADRIGARAAHPGRPHQVERAQRDLRLAPAAAVGRLEQVRAPAVAARLVRGPARVRRVDPPRAAGLEDLRRAVEAAAHHVAVEVGQRPARHRQPFGVDHHLTAVARPLQRAVARRVAQRLHQLGRLPRPAPGREDRQNARRRRGAPGSR